MSRPPLPGPVWQAFGLALQGRTLPRPPPASTDALVHHATAHRLEAVLHRALTRAETGWASALHDALSPAAQDAAVLDALRTRADADALAITGGVVFKGGALAHTVYAAPQDRPRTDLDVWIEPDRFDAVDRALKRAGYTAHLDLPSDLRALARSYARTDGGFVHAVDVHATPVRSVVHVDHFDREGAWTRARALPALGVRALGPEDALVVAAIHLFANNPSARRAITLVDVARLCGAEPDWSLTLDLAARARAGSLLWTTLKRAHAWLGADIPRLPDTPPVDESRVYLLAPPALSPVLEIALSEDLPTLTRRGRDLLWPDAEYLRTRAGVGRQIPRWRLAVARLLGG